MLMFGKNISGYKDRLNKMPDDALYKIIRNPDEKLYSKIQQLRTIATIDINKYRQLKTTLPYITCGIFTPPVRKTENFASINTFVLDIDHLNEKEMTVDGLKSILGKNNQVFTLFASPGNQGLKIMFRLKEKCYDHGQYSLFYRLFAKQFSEQYNLKQVIDRKTSDVTRACFLSHDPDCYYNPDAALINMNNYINFNNKLEVLEIEQTLKQADKENKEEKPIVEKKEISLEIFEQIKKKLNPKIRTQREKIIYTPEKLNTILETLVAKLKEFDIETKQIENINYGKKFRLELKAHWAEVNVFYGKKGFSVVKTPKRGSNSELADIVYKLFCEELF